MRASWLTSTSSPGFHTYASSLAAGPILTSRAREETPDGDDMSVAAGRPMSARCTYPRPCRCDDQQCEHGAVDGTRWGGLVVTATSAALDVLEPLTDRSWNARAGDLTWTCHQTAAHMASDLAKYAAQLASRTQGRYPRFGLTVPDDEPPAGLLRVVNGCGRLLGAVVDAAPTDARAWHWGPTDASGFAAMGIAELLVHTYDITLGLGHVWRPPRVLAQAVASRLLPGPPPVHDPSDLLLWSTGRIDVDGLDHVDDWVWRAADR
jgi:hypothetical protein